MKKEEHLNKYLVTYKMIVDVPNFTTFEDERPECSKIIEACHMVDIFNAIESIEENNANIRFDVSKVEKIK